MHATYAGTDPALCFKGCRRYVGIAPRVTRLMQAHRQTGKCEVEAFGVLVGRTSTDMRKVWVQAATKPMVSDVRARYSFQLCDTGHQRFVNEAFLRSGGSLVYLGTWHTHPEARPEPSSVDRADWRRCIQRNRRRPLVFAILGTERLSVFVGCGRWFVRLRGCGSDGGVRS